MTGPSEEIDHTRCDGRRRISFAEERHPCGIAGGLSPLYNRQFPFKETWQRDLSDCLVSRPKPWILVIWEPLLTKAPAPPKVRPWCCYSQTVIFYHAPYIPALGASYWRSSAGELKQTSRGFEEWDKIDYRLAWDDVVEIERERFTVGGGTVLWKRRRWWMLHSARRLP